MADSIIDNLIVRIMGDGSQFQKTMQDAAATTEATSPRIASSLKFIENAVKSIQTASSEAMQALEAIGAERMLRSAFGMFAETETATIKLKAAIKANGGAVDETLARYREFAKALKAATGASSDETLELLRTAEAMGFTGEAAERMVKNSNLLAAGGSTSADTAMRIMTELAKGNTRQAMHWAHHIQGLRGVRDETEFLAKVNNFMNIGLTQQGEILNSTEGVMKRFSGTVKGITKQFGEYVAEGVKPAVKWMTELLGNFTKIDEQTKRVIVGIGFAIVLILGIGPALAGAMALAKPFLALLMTSFHPISLVVLAVSAAIALMVNHFGGIEATFNKVKEATAGTIASIKAWWLEAWPKIREAAIIAWTWIQARMTDFLTWATPHFNAFVDFLAASWRIIKQLAMATWEGIKIGAQWAYENVIHWVLEAYAWTSKFIAKNKDLALILIVVAGAVVLLYGAYKAFLLVLSVTYAIAILFKLDQLANLVIWAANIVLVVGMAAAWLAWKAVVWLVNIALTTTSVLLGGIAVIAAGLLVSGIALAFIAAYAAIIAAYGALQSIYAALGQVASPSGPIGAVADLFRGWFDILKDVVRAAQTDLPLAWELLKAGAALAIEQVKQLWPPLWEFISTGFNALWEHAIQAFSLRFMLEMAVIRQRILNLGMDPSEDQAREQRRAERAVNNAITSGESRMRITMRLAQRQFTVPEANEAVQNAQREVNRIRDQINGGILPQWVRNAMNGQITPPRIATAAVLADMDNQGIQVGEHFAKGVHQGMEKFDAVLVNSAEARSRIAAYQAMLGSSAIRPGIANSSSMVGIANTGGPQGIPQPTGPQFAGGGGNNAREMEANNVRQDQMLDRLTSIRDYLGLITAANFGA